MKRRREDSPPDAIDSDYGGAFPGSSDDETSNNDGNAERLAGIKQRRGKGHAKTKERGDLLGDPDEESSSSGSSDGGEDSTITTNLPNDATAADRTPFHTLVIPVLRHLLPGELVSAALARLSATAKDDAAMSAIADASMKCAVQHDVALLTMTREAICRKAQLFLSASGVGAALPPMWVLKWAHNPAVMLGPFDSSTMSSWKSQGFFAKRKAMVVDANSVTASRSWSDANSVDYEG